MADNSRDEFGGWTEDEDSGFYGEPDEWFDLPKESSLQDEGQEEISEDNDTVSPEEPITTYRENEPEEELADWNRNVSESSYTEHDPFFDPDLPNIERAEEESAEEETEEEKPGKKFFPNFFASLKREDKEEKEKKEKKDRSGFIGKFNKKLLICIAAGAACAVAVFFLVFALLNSDRPKEEAAVPEEPEEVIATEDAAISSIRHLSFARLAAQETEGLLSVMEFSQILDSLYENDYVLVDVYAIAERDKEGNFTLSDHIKVPEGKKPLLISQRDVPDVSSYEAGTFADGLMIGEDGELRSAYTDADGNTAMGDLDVVPVLESFIREHPDFSYSGARGIAALTGYNGLIGQTQTAPEEVVQKMKERGWRFASNGYQGISYGSELSLIEEDTAAWEAQVKGLIGDTDLLILPRKTDISSWAPYQQENAKYTLLHGLGFRYFFIHTPDTPDLLQVEKEYVRQAILEIDTFEDFQNARENGAV